MADALCDLRVSGLIFTWLRRFVFTVGRNTPSHATRFVLNRMRRHQTPANHTPRSGTPQATVIVTTYRSPNYLRRVLQGFCQQSTFDFEVIVGEDGRTEATRAVVDQCATQACFSIHYLPQTRRGFGKTRILNRAIQASGGAYLIFTDGDCVPRFDFVQHHLSLARPGRFLSGGCCRLPRALTNGILTGTVPYREFTNAGWLKANGLNLSAKWIWIERYPGLATWFDRATTTRPTFNGHNASAWKEDLVRVNGFNLEMGYGGLDRELGERLENSGISGFQIRHQAVVFHLDHDRDYVSEADWQRNGEIREQVRRSRITRAQNGLEELRSAA